MAAKFITAHHIASHDLEPTAAMDELHQEPRT